MGNISPKIVPNETPMTAQEFLKSFNDNMPQGYPLVTPEILEKFKLAHPHLFKSPNLWTLDLHRKRMIEWLPQNLG